jgi:LPS-assembly lipoprotein
VQAKPNSSIAKALNTTLRINDIPVTADAKAAGFIIHLIEEKHSNRVVAVNSYGKVISTELEYRVIFAGLDKNSQIIAPNQTIEAFREYVNSETEVLGKSEEAMIIREDLEQDLANRILRRLRPYLKTTTSG